MSNRTVRGVLQSILRFPSASIHQASSISHRTAKDISSSSTPTITFLPEGLLSLELIKNKSSTEGSFKTVSEEVAKTVSEDRLLCRICLDEDKTENLVFLCWCKSSLGAVHVSCLQQWLTLSNRDSCEICHSKYNVRYILKYSAGEALVRWMCLAGPEASFCPDSAIVTFLTPIVICTILMSIAIGDYFSRQAVARQLSARMTNALFFSTILLCTLGYFLWILTLLEQQRIKWFRWWQNCKAVEIIHFSEPSTPEQEQPS